MNKRLKLRRKKPEKTSRPKPASLKQEKQWLDTESSKMAARVRELESFIVDAPRLEQEHRLRNVNIVPPPDFDFSEGGEHLAESRRMSYGRQERLQRIEHRNLVIFLALLCLAILFAIWFIQALL